MPDEETDKDFELFNGHLKISYKLIGWLVIAFILLLVLWTPIKNWRGNEEIGNWFEKDNYTTQYWVLLQPENAEVKNYRVKGDIERIDSNYYLNRVYWENGGYSDFDACDLYNAFKETDKNPYAICSVVSTETHYEVRIDKKVK